MKWKKNALRHSFISYRVAETQNVAQVALEAGNSPQIIFQHYRELVRLKEAKEWFAIEPNTVADVRRVRVCSTSAAGDDLRNGAVPVWGLGMTVKP